MPKSTPPKLKLLIADDEKDFSEKLRTMLEPEHFEVTLVPDGNAAVRILKEAHFSGILSDIRMPGNFSGIDLLKHVKKEIPATPIFLMTGFAMLLETQEAHELGADGMLSKPFKKEELISLLRSKMRPLPDAERKAAAAKPAEPKPAAAKPATEKPAPAKSPEPSPKKAAPAAESVPVAANASEIAAAPQSAAAPVTAVAPEPISNPEIDLDPAKHAGPLENDVDYCKLSIEDFVTGREIKFNIYIKLAPGRYLRIATEGEDLSPDRIKNYQNKSIRFLYLRSDDFVKYLQFNRVLTTAVRESKKVPFVRKMAFLKHANEIMLENLYQNDVSAEALEDAKAVLQTTLAVMADGKDTLDLLELLARHSDELYIHSMGVCLYGAMIARYLRWDSPQTLYKISIAGLLHDIGKKEIDPEILRKDRSLLTHQEVKILESHSSRGMEILSRVPDFPLETLQVIQQHHENCAGTGYPFKLSKARIQPLARLIAVTDEFCKLVLPSMTGTPPIEPKEAIFRLFMLYGETLDPTFVVPLAHLFQVDTSKFVRTL